MGKLVIVIAIIVVIAGGVFLILNNKNYSTNTTTSETNPSPSSNVTKESNKITVEASEFAFKPSLISFKKGEKVELIFKNNGQYPHNLTISDINLATKTVSPGGTDTITFTADKTGSFSFMCTIDSHADKGMKGTIVVE
ncbi:MAG: DUF4330 family protein [Candidatus Woesebacteria bacterium]|nr:MAG: DUF4330 family protein [Candidatus Woesebacteria bacterium]